MTKEQAEAVLDEKHPAMQGYVDIEPEDSCLDGWFNIRELEAIIVLMRLANENSP